MTISGALCYGWDEPSPIGVIGSPKRHATALPGCHSKGGELGAAEVVKTPAAAPLKPSEREWHVLMIEPPPEPGKQGQITTAAWNAVAVASLQWQESTNALRYVLSCAQGHGLTVPDLCRASGLDEAFVGRLLAEADL